MKDTKAIVLHILGIIAFLAGVIYLVYENEFRGQHSTVYVAVITIAGLAVGVTIHQLWCDIYGCCQYCNCEIES